MSSNVYLNNPNLKSSGVKLEYTEEQLQEIIRCAKDPIYFIRKYCKIISLDRGLIDFELFEYQERFILEMHNNNRIISMQPRQMGKTQVVASYILHYVLFNEFKTVAILANKAAAAREILSRFQLMYEHLPKWMQQGVTTWNKGDIELENGSKVFTAATSGAGIRGKSCVTSDTKVCILENDSVHYIEIDKIINNSIFINIKQNMKKYTVYKTTNLINNKIYIGFHSINESDILRKEFGHLSCFKDGYLGSGKLLIKAIEKYGPENFAQEILGIFDTKEDAENLEKNLVSKEFVAEDDNYNISVGGNVAILFGEANGFYNKKHSKETIEKIQQSRKLSNLPTYQCIITDIETGNIFKGFSEALNYYGYIPSEVNNSNKIRIFLGKLLNNNIIKVSKQNIAESLLKYYSDYEYLHSEEYIDNLKSELAETCRDRFKGITQSPEHVKKRTYAHKEWIKNNPEEHKLRMEKINKNPDKIRKTAEKHKGMKRSEDTRNNISKSLQGKPSHNKGTIMAYNPLNNEVRYFLGIDQIPSDWVKGSPFVKNTPKGKKSYTDGKEYKMFTPGTEPDGWVLGGKPKNK